MNSEKRAALGAALIAPRVALVAALVGTPLLVGCSSSERTYGVSASPRVITDGPIPRGGGTYKVGKPYQVAGRWHVPREDESYDRTGIASWYGEDFHGRKTANGEIYNMNALSAAHPTLPLPSYAYVTNLENGRTLLVRVNDRGPYANNRIIDLSRATARSLGLERSGLGRVRVRYAGPAPISGDDSRERRYAAEGRDASFASNLYQSEPDQRAYSFDRPPPYRAAASGDRWSPTDYRQAQARR